MLQLLQRQRVLVVHAEIFFILSAAGKARSTPCYIMKHSLDAVHLEHEKNASILPHGPRFNQLLATS
jgi:hypothetical protein